MNATNLERLIEFFGARGVTAALLSNPWTVAWLTGYAPPIQTGPSPFEGGPALAWWAGGELTLIASDTEAGPARAVGAEVRDVCRLHHRRATGRGRSPGSGIAGIACRLA